jgi:hypothetical protein
VVLLLAAKPSGDPSPPPRDEGLPGGRVVDSARDEVNNYSTAYNPAVSSFKIALISYASQHGVKLPARVKRIGTGQ